MGCTARAVRYERTAVRCLAQTQLTPVLRRGETFDVDGVIARYDRLWEQVIC